MIRTIPLNKLVRSTRNVRRACDEQADLQLKADIEARGLLQNLVVTSGAKRGCFAVEAGGRRLSALQRLAEEGKLCADHEVCCLVLEKGSATAREVSLAENFQRLTMNPADECLAFQQLIEQGSDMEGIARRFGLSVRFVEGRLRLATLAPAIFEALGSGDIGLEVAKAYAATPDQKRQAYVFEQMSRGYGAAHPDSIRRMMTQATVSATDRRARFVGEEAYVAAGGRIERDLFSDDAETRWLDVAILERLACEKLEALAAEAVAETGLGWIRPTLQHWLSGELTAGLRRVPLAAAPITDEESAAADALESEIEDIALSLENEDLSDERRSAADAKMRKLGDRIDALLNKPPLLDEELKSRAGAFLMLDDQGRPKLDTDRYWQLPAKDQVLEAEGAANLNRGAGQAERSAGLSQRLVDELAMQRRDILAVHVAADAGLALDLAIFLMVDRDVRYSCEKSGSSLIATPPANPVLDFRTPVAAATIARTEAEEALDRSWTDGETRSARFDAFRDLPEEARAAWLGHGVARTLEASLNQSGQRACEFHNHLGQLLGIDVARWWRPTGTNYFDRVPKSVTLAALAQVGGPSFAERYANAKKAELAQSSERIFSGDFIGEVEIKEAALAWVPEVMRFGTPTGDEARQETASSGDDVLSEPRKGDADGIIEAIEEAA